jgi:hypothetical protein
MQGSGADIAVVSKLLGQATIAITADAYGHLIGTIAQKAVDVCREPDCTHSARTSGGGCLTGVSF